MSPLFGSLWRRKLGGRLTFRGWGMLVLSAVMIAVGIAEGSSSGLALVILGGAFLFIVTPGTFLLGAHYRRKPPG
jgi:hypothetical protein